MLKSSKLIPSPILSTLSCEILMFVATLLFQLLLDPESDDSAQLSQVFQMHVLD